MGRFSVTIEVDGDRNATPDSVRKDFLADLREMYFNAGFRDYKIYSLSSGDESFDLDDRPSLPDMLRSLPQEELDKLPVPSKESIREALAKGRRERDAAEKAWGPGPIDNSIRYKK
jgi:hypothetical protein